MKLHACSFLCLVAAVSAANLVELAKSLGANTLVELVTKAGLANTLATGGPFTVFGPTDGAFQKLPKAILERLERDKQLLTDVLKYHVVSGSVYSSQLSNEQLAPSLLEVMGKPTDIRINIYNNGQLITAEGSPVTLADQNATNGVIHVVSRVLFPIPLRDIPGEVAGNQKFSTLLTAVQKASLATTLAGGPFTLFAPTNEAFAKIPTETLNKLLANVTALTDVLTYHVLKGTVWSASLSDGMTAPTVEGKSVTIRVGDGVMVNNAKVEEADLAVINGVIHVIDTVLLPPSLSLPKPIY